MAKPPITNRLLDVMGTNANLGVGVMCAIALFKGILRPIFALQDKKSSPETRKYTAMREGLTEVAALPMYATLPFACSWIAGKIFKGHNKLENIKGVTKFGALGLATFMVPVVCNKIQPPIMAAYKRHEDAKKTQLAKVNTQPLPNTAFKANYGMKVGG